MFLRMARKSVRQRRSHRTKSLFASKLNTAIFGLIAASLVCLARSGLAQTNFATVVPDGAWTWFNDPRALFHNGILYVGYVRNSDGASTLSAFNPATGAKTDLWTAS